MKPVQACAMMKVSSQLRAVSDQVSAYRLQAVRKSLKAFEKIFLFGSRPGCFQMLSALFNCGTSWVSTTLEHKGFSARYPKQSRWIVVCIIHIASLLLRTCSCPIVKSSFGKGESGIISIDPRGGHQNMFPQCPSRLIWTLQLN